jgi:predicted  nucleic acid-binding Zn-ribbon protein
MSREMRLRTRIDVLLDERVALEEERATLARLLYNAQRRLKSRDKTLELMRTRDRTALNNAHHKVAWWKERCEDLEEKLRLEMLKTDYTLATASRQLSERAA